MTVEISDTTPPSVERVRPAPDATGVALTTNVVAVFSEAMDPDTLNRRTVRLFRGGSKGSIRATLTYQEERRKVVLDPVERLRPNATYRTVVAESVRDSSGNPMTDDVAWTFTSEG